jgi:starch synthase
MTHIATITAELELHLVVPGGPSLPVLADLRYESNDPWAVRVAFQTGGEGDGVVEWMFARQLLTDGVAQATGEGDVRVWPSLHGTERVVNLEAMACGTPVVASRVGGIPEVVDDGVTGVLVDLGDDFEERFATEVSALLSDPTRATAMGAAGRERAVAEFGWDAIAARTVEVYRSVS